MLDRQLNPFYDNGVHSALRIEAEEKPHSDPKAHHGQENEQVPTGKQQEGMSPDY